MTFTMDTPMVFPILWVLPCISATVGTMGFAMYTPMGFPILCALVQSMHYRLRPIKEVQFGFAHFVSHFIRVQIFQIYFPLILSASKYF